MDWLRPRTVAVLPIGDFEIGEYWFDIPWSKWCREPVRVTISNLELELAFAHGPFFLAFSPITFCLGLTIMVPLTSTNFLDKLSNYKKDPSRCCMV